MYDLHAIGGGRDWLSASSSPCVEEQFRENYCGYDRNNGQHLTKWCRTQRRSCSLRTKAVLRSLAPICMVCRASYDSIVSAFPGWRDEGGVRRLIMLLYTDHRLMVLVMRIYRIFKLQRVTLRGSHCV